MIYLMMLNSEEEKNKFEYLYETYRNAMFNTAYKILNNKHNAEDAVHDSFVRVARNMKLFKDLNQERTKKLIICIVRNISLDAYRKISKDSKREISVDSMENPDVVVPASYIESDLENIVLYIINEMGDIYSEALMLKYVDGYKNKEIADILNIKESSVRKRIARGKKIIEKALEGMRDDNGKK